jgi:hypothetical protein
MNRPQFSKAKHLLVIFYTCKKEEVHLSDRASAVARPTRRPQVWRFPHAWN